MAHSASSRNSTSRTADRGGKPVHADRRGGNGHARGHGGAHQQRHRGNDARDSKPAGEPRDGMRNGSTHGTRRDRTHGSTAHSKRGGMRAAAGTHRNAQKPRAARVERHPGPCPIKQACGGCEWIGIPYRKQLARKQAAMEELFDPLIKEAGWDAGIAPIVGMEPRDAQVRVPYTPFGYRHKAASPFAPGPHGTIESGFFARGTHRIVTCPACAVEADGARRILNETAAIASRLGIAAYDEDRRRGLLRYAVVRMGWRADEAMLTLVTSNRDIPHVSKLVERLRAIDSRIVTIAQNINPRQTNAILGGETRILYGAERMRDRLLGCTFEISPTSFYQTNPQQTEVLYQLAIDGLELQANDVLIDAYCGSGTIGLAAADAARSRGAAVELIGIERNASGIRDARRNACINNLEGTARFIADDATAYLQRAAADGLQADALIMDPPRAGSTPEFLAAACAIGPRRIAYISCNPITQARDLADLARGGYSLRSLTPVDMFPHTSHTETVAILQRA